MKSYEFISNIVDRDDESDEVKLDIKTSLHNKVRFIYAESAIGKSSLSKKIIEKCKNDNYNLHIISVKTKPENATTDASDWLYIDRIFDSINQYFNSASDYKHFCFEQYINSANDKFLKKQIYESIIERIFTCKTKTDFILVFLFYHIAKFLKIKEFNPQNIAENNSYNSRIIKARYIQFIFLNINLFLVIDNIQNIDTISWKFFLDWLNMSKNKNHYIILEYTLSSNYKFENMYQMMEDIKDTGTQVVFSQLEKLSPEFVIDVIEHHFPNKPQDLDFNISLLKHYKTDAKGNLRQLIDYTIGYTPNKKENPSPTSNNLLKLMPASKYAFAILVNCNGEISFDLLEKLLQQIQISNADIENTLTELKNKEIINIFNGKVVITHAFLIDTWKKNSVLFDEYNDLAYAKMEAHFLNVLNTEIENECRNYAWIILLQLYATYNPYKINTLLENINEKIIGQISIAKTWKYLSLLIDTTEQKIAQFENMYFHILQICFEIELYNEGYSCLCLMENSINILNNSRLLLFKSMYLSALDMHEQNIELYNKFLPMLEKNSRAYFNLNMIVLCSFRSLNNYKKCFEIHRILYQKRKLMNLHDYSMFLRLTNVYLSDDKALYYAHKSIKKFHKLGEQTQEAKSMITYAKLLSGLGHNHKALKIISKAERLLENKYIGRHMIYNNQAAFLLMEGKTDNSILFLLDQAECSAIVPYDQLGIIVNKLVWCYQNRRYDILNLLIAKANRLMPQEPDEHVHILIYYNLYLLYNQNGEHQTALKYYQKAYEGKEKCKFVKARLDNIITKEMKYRLKYPWHVCYLSFWTYDLQLELPVSEYVHSS